MAFWPSLSTTIIELDKPQESNYTDTLAKYRQRSYETKFDASSVCTPNSVDPKVGVNDFLWTSGIPEKTWLILSSILPLGASVFLLVATLLERRWTGGLLAYVSENRATAQIISSVIAAILAALNIYTATTLINLAVRIRLLRKTMNLETLKLIGAVTTRQVALGLPLIMYLTSVAMALFCALPSFIWVGALTPIIENTTVVESSILKIPRYIERTSDLWSDNSDRNCPDITNNHGTWSACVARIAQSTLLNRASLASLNTTGGHAKFDNGQYSYIGRSYGVGTPAGIVDENLAQRHGSAELLSYSYTEPGYVSFVECMHNATSDWHLDKIQPGKPGNGIPDIYYALGHFPAAPPDKVDFFSVVSNDEKDLAVMGAKFYAGIHMVLIASAENYSVLNGTQCEILFQPAEFRVVVNTVKKQVSVFPIHGSNSVSNETRFDPTGGLAKTVTNQINLLAMITTSLYTSIVGDALVANIAFATSNSNASTSDPSADALRATADSLSAMVDALLVYVGSR
jgi:hypothetical protein